MIFDPRQFLDAVEISAFLRPECTKVSRKISRGEMGVDHPAFERNAFQEHESLH
jgi:hypothetical protein